MGTLITETSTYHHSLDISEVPPGDGHIDLEIDSLNLMPARYLFSLWLTGDGGHVFDGIEHCVKLEVENANIYSSGHTLDSRFGVVFFPQRWRLDGIPVEKLSREIDEPAACEPLQGG